MSFECKICDKQYSSYKSLWNHNKKFHKDNNTDVNMDVNTEEDPNDCIKKTTIKCTYCNKEFTTRQAKSLHIKKFCKKKQEIIKEKEKSDDKIKLQILKEESKILKLRLELEKAKAKTANEESTKEESAKLTPNKLNKLFENFEKKQINTLNMSNSNIIINNTQNNTIINNSPISTPSTTTPNNTRKNLPLLCDLHKINIHGFLTRQEKINIANKRHDSLEALVEKIYCGKVNKYKVVIVNNSSNNDIHLFVEKHNSFILEDKKEVLNKIIEFALGDLETIYDEVNDSIENLTKNSLKNFFHKLNYDKTKYRTDNGKVFETYRQFIEYKLNKMFYNNREKIMNDISNYIIKKEKELECV